MKYIFQLVRSYFSGTRTTPLSELVLSKPPSKQKIPDGEILGIIEHSFRYSVDMGPGELEFPILTNIDPPSDYIYNRMYMSILRRYYGMQYTEMIRMISKYRMYRDLIIVDVYTPALGWMNRNVVDDYEYVDNKLLLLVRQINNTNDKVYTIDHVVRGYKYVKSSSSSSKPRRILNMTNVKLYTEPDNKVELKYYEYDKIKVVGESSFSLDKVKVCIISKDPLHDGMNLLIILYGLVDGVYSGTSFSMSMNYTCQFVYLLKNATVVEHIVDAIGCAKDTIVQFKPWKATVKKKDSTKLEGELNNLNIPISHLDETISLIQEDDIKLNSVDFMMLDMFQLPNDTELTFHKCRYNNSLIFLDLNCIVVVHIGDFYYISRLLDSNYGSFSKRNTVYKRKPAIMFLSTSPSSRFTPIKPDKEIMTLLNRGTIIHSNLIL